MAMGGGRWSIHSADRVRGIRNPGREANARAHLRIYPRITAGNCGRLWRFTDARSCNQSATGEVTPTCGSRRSVALAAVQDVNPKPESGDRPPEAENSQESDSQKVTPRFTAHARMLPP